MNQHIKYSQINGRIKLAYQTIDKSAEQKPLLVFLHEGLGSIAQWKDFPDKLCEILSMDGLVYERYGYGFSTPFFDEREPYYLYGEAEYFLPALL